MSRPYSRQSDHLRLSIRLTPNARHDGFDGIEIGTDGEAYLKARVTEIPESGKANKALIALLASTLKRPKSSISILSGETARKKILRIDGDPEEIAEKLEAVLRG
ncbi:DUF167 domain-containing protein [Rhizobium sp. LC145]|uniref:DUF167 domain-containing protein n=1 Tax=Rhizobium sp. LC145 TaxID=1120688 RepID=UPI00062A2233|nr:DUF167 domain-containing protein [Rhizobium sp. LC145]KKX27761.1 hypothetical protein YH62_21240 [Rhizobium sp. LC145]TKT45560.1 DUF167 domain-containing protein [Rhizobiaceae bacterium LC148]